MQMPYIHSISWGTINGKKWNLMKEKPLTKEKGNITITLYIKNYLHSFSKKSNLQHVSSNFKCNA
jgi:hypothetical protein